MIDTKYESLLAAAEFKNFTRAAESLNLTQPAVSHHIALIEEELGTPVFIRGKKQLTLTPQGEIVVRYARQIRGMYTKLRDEIYNFDKNRTRLRVGITHTEENGVAAEVFTKVCSIFEGLSISITTNNIKNLYDMLENYELDMAIVNGTPHSHQLSSIMLDTDYLICVAAPSCDLTQLPTVNLNDLKTRSMILRPSTSATRALFESTLSGIGDSIENFNIMIEVDSLTTIKNLVMKNMGISILPKSACTKELAAGSLKQIPIENVNMMRETKLVYGKDFSRRDILETIVDVYQHREKHLS